MRLPHLDDEDHQDADEEAADHVDPERRPREAGPAGRKRDAESIAGQGADRAADADRDQDRPMGTEKLGPLPIDVQIDVGVDREVMGARFVHRRSPTTSR